MALANVFNLCFFQLGFRIYFNETSDYNYRREPQRKDRKERDGLPNIATSAVSFGSMNHGCPNFQDYLFVKLSTIARSKRIIPILGH